jgi:hypothetical protein
MGDIDQKTRDYIDHMVDYAQDQDKRAETLRQQVLTPAISDMRRAVFIVWKYIKDKDRIMYGGTGINMAVKKKSSDNALYSEDEFPDYDFYSPDPIYDGIELCNRLEDAGFQHVQMQEAVHPYTYKLHVEYYPKEVADITFVPKVIYDKIPTLKYERDGMSLSANKRGSIRLAHPNFMIIDIYRQFCNPITGWLKIHKAIKRKILLEKLYLPITTDRITFKNIPSTPEFKVKREFIYTRYLIHQPDIIFTGSMVYNEFIRKSGTPRKSMVSTNSLECMSEKAKQHMKHLTNMLQKEYPNDQISVKEYQPFFQFLPPFYVLHAGKDDLLTLYNTSGEWKTGYPYWTHKESNSAIVKFASYYLILQILSSKQFVFYVRGMKDRENKYKYMIQELRFAKQFWIEKDHNVEEVGPFEELPYLSLGTNIEIPSVKIRKARVENIKRRQPYVYTYRPGDKRLNPKEERQNVNLVSWTGKEIPLQFTA